MHSVFHAMVAHKETRKATLKYIGDILLFNARRIQFSCDEKSLARDGYALNLMSVLQLLSLKIKMDRIEVKYPFLADSLINIDGDTKLRLTEDEFKNFVKEFQEANPSDPEKEINFQTHCWFLTLQSLHLSIIPAIHRYRQKLRAVKELQKLLDEIDRTKPQWENTPYAPRNMQYRDRWNKQLKKFNRSKLCSEISLLDPVLLNNCLSFYSTACEYMLYQMEERPISGPYISQNNPTLMKPSEAFSALPEWFIDDIAEFILFAMQTAQDEVRVCIDHSIITWILTCVCAPHCIKNPYVVAKLVEVLFVFSLSGMSNNSLNTAVGFMLTEFFFITNCLKFQILNHELAQTVLVGSLMKFYTEIETTGQSTEFYDKFTIR